MGQTQTGRTQASKPSLRFMFVSGAGAGIVALLFNFVLRLGGLAPFPPESGVEAFLKIIPESIQEPAVQRLGDFAGQLGLIVATALAVVLYGFLGILLLKGFAPKFARLESLSFLESSLLYSFVPWILFDFVLLPAFGVSWFGLSSVSSTSTSVLLYPISLLLVQEVFSFVLYLNFRNVDISYYKKSKNFATRTDAYAPRNIARRSFVEKGVLAAGVVAFSAVSLDRLVSPLFGNNTSLSTQNGSTNGAVDLQDAPTIFRDHRLATLVDNEVTSNASFYRVAIDLFDPIVNSETWSLQVGGLVASPNTYNLDSLQSKLPTVSEYSTFECVSNEINGNLIGNAKWTGVRISDLLKDVGETTGGAQYVVFSSIDGYSVSVPLSKAIMPDSILAYQMNDQPLPQKHGFPLRAVIPGLYGMMSAKWINKIDIVDTHYEGYWQTRGWSDMGTAQTQTFISLPGDGASSSLSKYNGSVILGGAAYAGDRGISKVEVSTDGGRTWQTAELKKSISNDSWTLWAYDWHPSQTRNYNVYARAIDGNGAIQTSNQTSTFPNGATGYAMIEVNVSD